MFPHFSLHFFSHSGQEICFIFFCNFVLSLFNTLLASFIKGNVLFSSCLESSALEIALLLEEEKLITLAGVVDLKHFLKQKINMHRGLTNDRKIAVIFWYLKFKNMERF